MSDQTEGRRSRKRREAAPTTADAVEIAMDRIIAGEPEDGPAHAVLRGHRDLLRWQTISERMSVALKVLTGLTGVLVAGALIYLVWSAVRYQGLVVQPLSVAPDLAERGLTGEVLAGDLLDRLVSMQEQTDSVRAPGSYAIDWGSSVEVEIPQTGVSIGELQRFLRSWLGKETRISGVVYRARDGRLFVTARTGGTSGVTFSGTDDELPDLMQKAAESVYARTQPYRFTVYLGNAGREDEALPIYRQAASYGETEEAWLVRGWGIVFLTRGEIPRALELYREVEAKAPDMGPLFQTIGDAESYLGHDEAAYQAYVRAADLIGRSREVDPLLREDYARLEAIEAAVMVGDIGLADRLTAELEQMDATGGADAVGHRPGALERAAMDGIEEASPEYIWSNYGALAVAALERADPVGALRWLDLTDAAVTTAGMESTIPVGSGPLRIRSLILLRRLDEATALAAALPQDCADCMLVRAETAEARGDQAAADRLFAHASAMTPSLPRARLSWGKALLMRGDTAGAIEKARAAARLAPRFADPLKLWGDALMAQDDPGEAIRKYQAAARLNDRWGALQLAWGRALEARGRRDQAAERYRAAQGLDLTSADRIETARRLDSVTG
ncbi:hypothetical protein [Brevundimonas sp.]|uniref:hypothetical protein n=1 Tax=Brevundimonas sp. TaxID=1871086 RepID=UPI00286A52CE|nr:hypothetical protein [Brevundimonas sp.]